MTMLPKLQEYLKSVNFDPSKVCHVFPAGSPEDLELSDWLMDHDDWTWLGEPSTAQ